MKTVRNIASQPSFNAMLASSIHDVKNSLGMVINTLDLFIEEKDRPLEPKRISQLQFEARRINENLIQLLTLYKSENGLLTTHIDEHDVEEFLDEVITQENTIAEAKGIKLSAECTDGLIGYFDSDLITAMLRNAIHNALRHTKDSIHVIARQGDDKSLLIQVIDNGPGIKKSLSPDKFPMPDTSDHTNGGTGLGLHFCNIVAKLHTNRGKQGHITLENRKDASGAVFTIYLP